MKLRYSLSKLAVRIGAIVSSAVLLLNTGVLIEYKADALASCTFETGCTCKGCEQDPRTWNQTTAGCSGVNAEDRWSSYAYASETTIAQTGCYLTSVATLMGMSGVFGDKFCPMQYFRWVNEHEYCSASGSANGTAFTEIVNIPGHEGKFATVPPISKDTLATSLGVGEMGDGDDSYAAGGHQDIYKLAVALCEKGYYVVIHRPGHYTAVIDVIDSSNSLGKALIVSDGAAHSDDGPDFNELEKIGSYVPYDDKDRTPPDGYFLYSEVDNNLDSLRVFVCESSPFTGKVNASGGSGGAANNPNAPTMVGLSEFLAEEYFIDMNKLQEPELELFGRVEFVESSGLKGLAEVENWADTIDNKHEEATHRYVRAAFMFVGILIMIYSVILFIAYQFDKVNNFVEIQLLGVLTFNRLAVSPDDKQSNYANVDSNGTKYLKLKDICIVSVVGISIGVLLVSGKVFLLVMNLINWIDDLFKNWGM